MSEKQSGGCKTEANSEISRLDLYNQLLDLAANGNCDGFFDTMEEIYKIDKVDFEINFSNDEGNTALHLASREGESKIVSHLLQLSADPNLQNHEGQTALHLAVHKSIDN